jgi:hypothetical protein
MALSVAWVILHCEADCLKRLRSSSRVPAFAVRADNHEVGKQQTVNLPLFCLGVVQSRFREPTLSRDGAAYTRHARHQAGRRQH